MYKCYKCETDLKLKTFKVFLYMREFSCEKCKARMIYNVPASFTKYSLIFLRIIEVLVLTIGYVNSNYLLIGLWALLFVLETYLWFYNSKILPNEAVRISTKKRKILIYSLLATVGFWYWFGK